MLPQRKHIIRLIAIVAVFVALSGAFLDERVTHAQGGDDDHVDVGLTLEAPNSVTGGPDLRVVVVNNGSRTAFDVVVVVDLVSPEKSLFPPRNQKQVPVGTLSFESSPKGTEKARLRWTIPELGAAT